MVFSTDSRINSINYKSALMLTQEIKDFIMWLDDPVKCPFNHCFNGLNDDKPGICYERNNKHYTLDQVWEIWLTTVK